MWSSFVNALQIPSHLEKKGVLGMNKRNHAYIGKYNDRSRYPLVDDKLKTKIIAEKHGAACPEMIGVIRNQAEVKHIHNMIKDWPGFVIKPAQGSGGRGILVVVKHDQNTYTKPSGVTATRQEVERHVSNVLAGLFSLGGKTDVAIIENLILFDDCFDGFTYEGVPDVRVIVFKGYPIMAMMRCSTSASDGKANLHQGAVGVGIDIGSGNAIRAVQFERPLTHHPDTGIDLSTLKVPQWGRLLEIAASAWEMTGLGYMGTDMVLDKIHGPMVLELNARPGLSIQIANGQGLIPRLRHIETMEIPVKYPSPEQRVKYCMNQFGTQPNFE